MRESHPFDNAAIAAFDARSEENAYYRQMEEEREREYYDEQAREALRAIVRQLGPPACLRIIATHIEDGQKADDAAEPF